MGTRGRKSTASLSVIGASGIEPIQRPGPPCDLTPEQADEWLAVVNRLPADWFPRETWGMLAQYCRHVVASRHVARLIEMHEDAETIDIGDYDKLLKMQERESRAISSLATRMRMSQHSTYDAKKKKPTMVANPWDD